MTLSVSARRVNGGNYMPDDWVPSKNDVIIGRGKRVYAHVGNQKLRALVQQEVEAYSNAKNRAAKSVIIIRIFKAIRVDTEIGFVKKDPATKKFYAVEDTAAKITIAQYFRDALADGYKSSKQYKQKLRDELKRSVSDVGQPGAVMPGFSNQKALKRSASAGDSYHATLQMSFTTTNNNKDECCQNSEESPSYFMKMARARCNPPVIPSILHSASDILEDGGKDCEWPDLNMVEETNVRIPASDKEAFANLYKAFGSKVDKTSNPFEPTPLKESSSTQMVTADKVESVPFDLLSFEDSLGTIKDTNMTAV